MASGPLPRMTLSTRLVLHALLDHATEELYGAEVGAAAGLPSGTLHPILARLERLDWVSSRWEDVDPRAEGRPARRYYRLTAEGARAVPEALARAYQPSAARLRLRPAGG